MLIVPGVCHAQSASVFSVTRSDVTHVGGGSPYDQMTIWGTVTIPQTGSLNEARYLQTLVVAYSTQAYSFPAASNLTVTVTKVSGNGTVPTETSSTLSGPYSKAGAYEWNGLTGGSAGLANGGATYDQLVLSMQNPLVGAVNGTTVYDVQFQFRIADTNSWAPPSSYYWAAWADESITTGHHTTINLGSPSHGVDTFDNSEGTYAESLGVKLDQSTTPEPGSASIVLCGLGLGAWGFRRRKH